MTEEYWHEQYDALVRVHTRLSRDYDAANANLTATQRRCTELLEETRVLKRSITVLRCAVIIPGTTIACGEGGNYCSDACMEAAR